MKLTDYTDNTDTTKEPTSPLRRPYKIREINEIRGLPPSCPVWLKKKRVALGLFGVAGFAAAFAEADRLPHSIAEEVKLRAADDT